MDFGEALKILKKGGRVCRKGWNGKGMFLFLVSGASFDREAVPGEPFPELVLDTICVKTAQDNIVMGWLASQTDMLAEDWEEVV